MAHVARVDETGIVRDVHVIDNADLPNGGAFSPEAEAAAQEFQQRLGLTPAGHEWYLTSYNDSFRFRYAGQGMVFDPDLGPDGAFIPPQPFPSWTLNADTASWDAPVPMPTESGPWMWDEATLSWVSAT